MELIVDSREHDFANSILLNDHKVENLDIGDFSIKDNGVPVCLIERKKISDYASSISDMRNKNQLMRINDFRQDNPDCVVIYVVEGHLDTNETFYGSIKGEDIYSSMCNKILRDRIFIFQTENINGTIKFINKIHDKLKKGIDKKTTHYASTLKYAKKEYMTHNNWYICSLAQIPSVSVNIAEVISNTYPTLLKLIEGYKNGGKHILSDLMYGKRRIGNVISERIYEFLIPNDATESVIPTPIETIVPKKLKLKLKT